MAGTLLAALDSAVAAAPRAALVEQALGIELSTAGIRVESFALSSARDLLARALPASSQPLRVVATLLNLADPRTATWAAVRRVADTMARAIAHANATARAIAVTLVASTWCLMPVVRAYVARARGARTGVYPFLCKRGNIGGASSFIGIQPEASLAALSFALRASC